LEEKTSKYHILQELKNDWICRNLITIIVLILYTSYGILVFFPYYYSWFEFHRSILAFEEIFIGIVELPLRLIDLGSNGTLWYFSAFIAIVYLFIVGLGVGLITQAVLKKGRIGKIIVICAILTNGAFGWVLMVLSDIPVRAQISQNCENMISNSLGLRIIAFDEIGFESGSQFFYLITSNGGKNWKQLMTTRMDDPAIPHCNVIGSIGDDFLWVWSPYNVRTSQDGGKTWNEWDWKCCSYGAVEEVSFVDTENGVMSVYTWGSNISQLTTVNGGITWEPKE